MIYASMEMSLAAYDESGDIGRQRQEWATRTNVKDKNGFKGDGLKVHMLGARCEKAFSVHYDLPWKANIGRLREPDVGEYQVRSSVYDPSWLRLDHDDKDHEIFVLVRNLPKTPRVFEFLGCQRARVGKTEQWFGDKWKQNRPTFWFPDYLLLPMSRIEARERWKRERAA